MIQEEIKDTFNESVELRERIQNELREDQKNLKKLVEIISNDSISGNEFNNVVNMYHYREGGYPSPNSKPRHVEFVKKFVSLYKILNFLELDDFLCMELYGASVVIHEPIEDFTISGDSLETIKERGYTATTFKEFLTEALLRGDHILTSVCNCADIIKEKAKEIEETANIKKKHYGSAVMTEVKRRNAGAEGNVKRANKIEESINEDYESYVQSLGLLEIDQENGK